MIINFSTIDVVKGLFASHVHTNVISIMAQRHSGSTLVTDFNHSAFSLLWSGLLGEEEIGKLEPLKRLR